MDEDGLMLAEGDMDAETDEDGDLEADGEILALGLTDADIDEEGLTDADALETVYVTVSLAGWPDGVPFHSVFTADPTLDAHVGAELLMSETNLPPNLLVPVGAMFASPDEFNVNTLYADVVSEASVFEVASWVLPKV